jgi:hypothetical protein
MVSERAVKRADEIPTGTTRGKLTHEPLPFDGHHIERGSTAGVELVVWWDATCTPVPDDELLAAASAVDGHALEWSGEWNWEYG